MFTRRSTTLCAIGAGMAILAAAAAAQSLAAPAVRDLGQEEKNRALVVGFYETVFVKHDLTTVDQVLAESYRQHNPLVPTGRAPFVGFFTGLFQKFPAARSTIVRSATDGDLVYLHVHSQMTPDDRGRAIVDIFRVADGKIVEHWDVIQAVPATSANTNTMF